MENIVLLYFIKQQYQPRTQAPPTSPASPFCSPEISGASLEPEGSSPREEWYFLLFGFICWLWLSKSAFVAVPVYCVVPPWRKYEGDA